MSEDRWRMAAHPLATPADGDADGLALEGELDEEAHRAGHAGGDHVVVGRLLLQHHPHHLHVVARVAPVALGVDVAHEELVLQPLVDARDRTRHLSRDERGPSARRLVVEEDAVGRVDAVRLAVVDDDPVGVLLGDGVRRARVERRRLALRHLLHQPVQLRRRRLVEAAFVDEAGRADRVQQPEHAHPVRVRRVLGHLKRHLDV
mmetsp:Transcript_31586/g.82523  ORF Transcript_31586/g.82523 Transcript_31586/m.82523 type:complete len:204 (+) Transcript_31586:1001-1612(+)